jgi:hypothetical protein
MRATDCAGEKPRGKPFGLTASVDEIIAVGDKARALNIKVEISQAKITAFGQELACLELVEREHPRLIERNPNEYISRNIADEFKRAFYDVGSITRLSEPSQKVVFSTHVDRLNNLLRRRGHPEVGSMTRAVARSPNALWTPCIIPAGRRSRSGAISSPAGRSCVLRCRLVAPSRSKRIARPAPESSSRARTDRCMRSLGREFVGPRVA